MDSDSTKNLPPNCSITLAGAGDTIEECPVNIYSSLASNYRKNLLEVNNFLQYMRAEDSDDETEKNNKGFQEQEKQFIDCDAAEREEPSENHKSNPSDAISVDDEDISVVYVSSSNDTHKRTRVPPCQKSTNLKRGRGKLSKINRQTQQLLRNLERKRLIFYGENPTKEDLSNSICLEGNANDLGDDDCICVDDDYVKYITAKIRCKDSVLRITMTRTQKFSTILPELAAHCHADVSCILLCMNERKVKCEDTPDSLGMEITDILDCYIMKSRSNSDEYSITINVQASDSRKKVSIKMQKDHPLSEMMESYSKQKEVQLENLVFKFDGEVVLPAQTPEDLDMEDGSCVDVIVST